MERSLFLPIVTGGAAGINDAYSIGRIGHGGIAVQREIVNCRTPKNMLLHIAKHARATYASPQTG